MKFAGSIKSMEDKNLKRIEQHEVDEEPTLTRQAIKETPKPTPDEESPKKVRWVQIRMIPIWLRIILVALLLAAVVVIGLRVGYGVIGDGNPGDVLKKETWLHIVDIIKGKE